LGQRFDVDLWIARGHLAQDACQVGLVLALHDEGAFGPGLPAKTGAQPGDDRPFEERCQLRRNAREADQDRLARFQPHAGRYPNGIEQGQRTLGQPRHLATGLFWPALRHVACREQPVVGGFHGLARRRRLEEGTSQRGGDGGERAIVCRRPQPAADEEHVRPGRQQSPERSGDGRGIIPHHRRLFYPKALLCKTARQRVEIAVLHLAVEQFVADSEQGHASDRTHRSSLKTLLMLLRSSWGPKGLVT